jgi:hypothetical protein
MTLSAALPKSGALRKGCSSRGFDGFAVHRADSRVFGQQDEGATAGLQCVNRTGFDVVNPSMQIQQAFFLRQAGDE